MIETLSCFLAMFCPFLLIIFFGIAFAGSGRTKPVCPKWAIEIHLILIQANALLEPKFPQLSESFAHHLCGISRARGLP
jgi:hypothetical protein